MTAPESPRRTTVQAIAEHPATPWVTTVAGLGLVALGGVLMYQEKSADKWHLGFHGGTVLFGLILLPGALEKVKELAATALPFVPWAKKDPPPGGAP